MIIRQTVAADHEFIDAIVEAAFKGVGEVRLVHALRDEDAVLELSAIEDDEIVGHIMFSRNWIEDDDMRSAAVQLAPVSVAPKRQSDGIGGALIREGLAQLRTSGESHVFVLGHLEYYPRFGFSADAALPFKAPWSGPAHMLTRLRDGGPERGLLIAPQAFFT